MSNSKQSNGDTDTRGGQKSGQQSQGGAKERDTDADRKGSADSNTKSGGQQGGGMKKPGQTGK